MTLSVHDPARRSAIDRSDQIDIEQFLYAEAGLLDDRDFDTWITLFTPDVHYWMPVRTARFPRDTAKEWEPAAGSAYFDESFDQLRERVKKLATGRSWSETPPSRTRHLVTNVQAFAGGTPDEWEVRSAFLVYRTRGETYQDVFAGRRVDVLRRRPDAGFAIARRHIFLDQTVLMANNLSIFF